MELDHRFEFNESWSLTLYGEQGDSGKRIIWSPLYDQIINDNGQKSLVCFIEAVTLKNLNRIALSSTKLTAGKFYLIAILLN